MQLILPFFLGFLAATIGVAPPGLLNMTAAKVSVKEGKTRGFWFAGGASMIVFLQTLLAVYFARFINNRADIGYLLQEIGFVLFTLLTVYFFWVARKKTSKKKVKELKMKSKSSRFFMGMLLSSLNVFPVPYYVFVSITLASYDYFFFEPGFLYVFSLGTAIAAFIVFYWYILYFKNQQSESSFIMRNINYIIGSITGIVALITLVKLLKDFL
jgi:threonine/homoserine/homoserine lactone efflux protein